MFKNKLCSDHKSSKAVRKFYERQNQFIRDLEAAHCDLHGIQGYSNDVPIESSRVNKKQEKKNHIVVMTIFIGNLLLAIAKIIASVRSGSLAVISSVLDSFVDLFSGIIIWIAIKQSKRFLPYTYPEGRNRIESVAVLVLSVIMCSASIQIVINSVEMIVKMSQGDAGAPEMNDITVIIMASCVALKIIFVVLCLFVGKGDAIKALLMDQRNDCITITATIIFSTLSSRIPSAPWLMYLDPSGAILIAAYIIYSWAMLAKDHIENLVGKSADPPLLQKIAFISLNHDQRILRLDTVRAFHLGKYHLAEVDIVLSEKMPLKEAHDIGETLQNKLEMLPEIERAFVHLDYESEHHPHKEHKKI